MIVLDASAWVTGLVDSTALGDAVRQTVGAAPRVVVPAHCRLEVARTLARLEQAGTITAGAAATFVDQVLTVEAREVATDEAMLRAVWQLRHNISPYDAPYVVIARALDVPLVTCDGRLARGAERLDVVVRHIGA